MKIKQLKLNGTAFYPKVGVDSIVDAAGTESAVDTVVTENSTNLITSGAVYNAVPTKTSDLTNDSNFVNQSQFEEAVGSVKAEIIGNATSACDTLGLAEALITAEVTARENAVSTEVTRAQAAEDALLNLYQSISQSAIEVVDTLPQTGEVNKIYRLVGTTSYSDYMYNADDLTTPILMATYNNSIDDEPTAGSDNLVKSGGIDGRIGCTETLISKYIFRQSFANGSSISIDKRYNLSFKQGDVYFLRLSEDSDLESIYLYLVAKGSSSPTYKGVVNKTGIYINVDIDAVAFALYAGGTSGDRLIEMEISNVTYLHAELNNIRHNIVENGRIIFNGIFEYKTTAPLDSRTPLSIPAGTRTKIFVNSNLDAEGTVYIYLLNANHETIVSSNFSMGGTFDVKLEQDVSYIQWYIDGSYIIKNGLFDICVTTNDSEQENENKILDTLTRQIYKRAILFQDGKGGSRQGNRQPLSILKGSSVRILMHRRTNQTGNIQLYLEDASTNIVLSKSFNVAGTDEIYVATDDIAYITYYYADSAGSITKPGIVDLAISAIETEDTYKDNVIYGPIKEKRIKGNTAYLREEILNIDAKEGDTFFIGFDSVIGSIYGSAVTVRFLDSSNNILVSDNINYSEIEVAPENTAKIAVYLYPNQTSTEHNIDVTYKNLYIAKGVDAKFNINGTLSSVSQPKDYYFTNNYLNGKVARINELMESNYQYGDAFFFITDLHWSRYNQRQSPSLIQYIMDRTHVTKLIGGGDYEDQGADSNHNLLFNLLTNNYRRNDLNIVVGNHEYLQGTSNGIIASLYHGLSRYEPNYNGKLEKWYYFYDDNFRGIRWIFLASYDEGISAASDGYSVEQKEWLENVALNNVPSGYDIVCVAHGACGINQGPSNNNEFVWSNEKPIADIFDEYKESNPTTHILNIRGHVHRDRIAYTDGGLTYIMTTCDKNVPWPSESDRENPQSSYYQWYPDLNVDRTSGTIHEQAFDVMILNTHTHTLTAVRIGGKARDGVDNNAGDEVEERVVTY